MIGHYVEIIAVIMWKIVLTHCLFLIGRMQLCHAQMDSLKVDHSATIHVGK
jgi:hypothetical protein